MEKTKLRAFLDRHGISAYKLAQTIAQKDVPEDEKYAERTVLAIVKGVRKPAINKVIIITEALSQLTGKRVEAKDVFDLGDSTSEDGIELNHETAPVLYGEEVDVQDVEGVNVQDVEEVDVQAAATEKIQMQQSPRVEASKDRRLKVVLVTVLSLGVLCVLVYRVVNIALGTRPAPQVTSRKSSAVATLDSPIRGIKLIPPTSGVYHAAHPDFGGYEDQVTAARIQEFERLAQKEVAWVYFSNNWFPSRDGISFPSTEVEVILEEGKTPFISLMARGENETLPYPHYALQRFVDGDFDADLRQWARAAKAVGEPLLVEFGREVNGDWFPWTGTYNGAGETEGYGNPDLFDGQERFRDAYRHIVNLFQSEGASNITWFFHVDCYSDPNEPWNDSAGYYPGDAYIDWIGISCYGPQEPGEGWWLLSESLNDTYEVMSAISRRKPLALLEFAVTDELRTGDKAAWIRDAFAVVRSGQYPRIKAVSWWHENFDQSKLRIDSSEAALQAYRQSVEREFFVTEPKFKQQN